MLERMIGRRAFLRKALYAALALTGYGTGCMAGGLPGIGGIRPARAEGIEVRAPGTVPWVKKGQRDITIVGKLPARLVSADIPGGLVLCAVEANRQAPYCATLDRGRATAGSKSVREGGSVRFEVRADIVAALGLPELETTYFIHASCGRYRSGVVALKMVKGT